MRSPWRAVMGLMVLAMQSLPGAPASPDAQLLTKENLVDAARPNTAWFPAVEGQQLFANDRVRTGGLSRATVRLSDLSVLRVNELTTVRILPPAGEAKAGLDLKSGLIYFFSREKAEALRILTPIVTGALRGTEFQLAVGALGRTTLTMLDGEVELANQFGRVTVRSGEQGQVEPGRAPTKTAVIEAHNIIQWCLYYPGILQPEQLGLPIATKAALSGSLRAYEQGDLLAALAKYPAGKTPASPAERVYRAGLLLEVGQVEKARAQLAGVPAGTPGAEALRRLIAAVTLEPGSAGSAPVTAMDWLAESYGRQARGELEPALAAAQRATDLAPDFGFAWARLAELHFSFGRILKAHQLLERALELSPRHAQAHALQGFLLSAENHLPAARRSFDRAIEIDPALGNAWLGRGLTFIRQGQETLGRQDLQTAATLEPNRSLFRSYLGKALSQTGHGPKAREEFSRAIELDPADPTPWLYSAIEKKQENRYNEAIDALEKSIALNDNRRLYRSGLLLDQDRGVRGTNLAAIYQNNGMPEQSVREAVRAVDADYGSAPAHLFLSNSYNALRDPQRINLRYETPWENELLLSQLLSPVGGGPLSQFVSEQEYSKMFERDGFGFSSLTDYYSYGDFRETASQYGTFGNFSYALDTEYQYFDGLRPNNRLSRSETFATFKYQLGPLDTIFLRAEFIDQQNGDLFQRYDPHEVSRQLIASSDPAVAPVFQPNRTALTYHSHEEQYPGILLAGWHREWSPGNHTLLLAGRLADQVTVNYAGNRQLQVIRDVTNDISPSVGERLILPGSRPSSGDFAYLSQFAGKSNLLNVAGADVDTHYRTEFEIYTAELQQIVTHGPNTLLFGGRYQNGDFTTHVLQTNFRDASLSTQRYLPRPTAKQVLDVDQERISLYLYDNWKVFPWLSLTGGVVYDKLTYPANFRSPPVNDDQATLERVSPKAGLILQPFRGTTVRAAYLQATSGTSFDESVRLEPTQVSGFVQGYRGIASESLLGTVAANRYQLTNVSLEQKLSTQTFLGVEWNLANQRVDRSIGTFDRLTYKASGIGIVPSALLEQDEYDETCLTATINQLVGDRWSLGARYRYTRSELEQRLPALEAAFDRPASSSILEDVAGQTRRNIHSDLHQLGLTILFNDPSGIFGRLEANWYQQANSRLAFDTSGSAFDDSQTFIRKVQGENTRLPSDDFWQFNLIVGYRFHRNQCELSGGILNLTDQDYRLSPLTPYYDLPRERSLFLRCKLLF